MCLDDTIRKFGFADVEEFNRMVQEVDLTDDAAFAMFKRWKLEDGTKAGLEAINSRSSTPHAPSGLSPSQA